MQYVRSISGSISGSVSKTWNSINPATLSGAIDVVVVEREDGTLACSPFHVRFGKFQLLQPFNKKVEFTVNDVKREFPMKVGEGGEAFFVFETSDTIPREMQTSPLVSPMASPSTGATNGDHNAEPEPLDLGSTDGEKLSLAAASIERPKSAEGTIELHATDSYDTFRRPMSGDWSATQIIKTDDDTLPNAPPSDQPLIHPPSVSPSSAEYLRAVQLSKRLWSSNIPTTVSPSGDLMLDMTGYKSNDDRSLQAEVIARKILSEEIEGNVDIGSLIGADDKGNIWIYSSEEAKDAADRKLSSGAGSLRALNPVAMRSQDAMSDPGYHSDDNPSDSETIVGNPANTKILTGGVRRDSDSAVGMSASGSLQGEEGEHLRRESTGAIDAEDPAIRNFAKTLRLTHDQLKSLDLKPGANSMSFAVGKAACQGFIYYWQHDVPIVISDIDGTITKSDALGHVLNMIGRDWTHMGVAKLYTDIVANGYHILYLTSRSVGQADMTRGYLNGVVQDGYKLPKGPVIMSPDRTMAALRREVYLRKPEVFKMACLRDIVGLFQTSLTNPVPAAEPVSPTSLTGHAADTAFFHQRTPFYAGFGNRLTDALSYRSVGIPPTRIFTINSNAEVSLHLLTLNTFRTSYMSIWELVDHYFPPVGLLVQEGGEEYTDFNYWREPTLEADQFSGSESDSEDERERERRRFREDDYDEEDYDEEEGDYEEDMEGSFMSRDSLDGASYMSRDSIDGASYMSRDSIDGDVDVDDPIRESGLLAPVVEEDEDAEAEDYDEDEQLEDVVPDDEVSSEQEKTQVQRMQDEAATHDEAVLQNEDDAKLEEVNLRQEENHESQNGSASHHVESIIPMEDEAEPNKQDEEDDIVVTESIPIQALNLEAEEEVVHSPPDLNRATTLPERDTPGE